MEIRRKWNVAAFHVTQRCVKTDGQSSQTVLLLAPYEKLKLSAAGAPWLAPRRKGSGNVLAWATEGHLIKRVYMHGDVSAPKLRWRSGWPEYMHCYIPATTTSIRMKNCNHVKMFLETTLPRVTKRYSRNWWFCRCLIWWECTEKSHILHVALNWNRMK